MERIGFGLIGCGGMGLHLAAQAALLDGVSIAAVADPDPERAARAAAQLGAPSFENHLDLLASPGVDAVIVASPNKLHAPHAIDAARAGKHIFCEKPMAPTVAECDSMIAAAREADVMLMVAQVLRFFSVFQETRRLVESGVIGKPVAMRVTRTSDSRAAFGHGWRSRQADTGGVLLEINAHEIDFMRCICGEAATVFAQARRAAGGAYDYPDTFFVQVGYRDGAIGLLHSGIASPVGEYHMAVQGTSGALVNGGFGGPIRYAAMGEQETVVDASTLEAEEPYHHELRLFVEALRDGRESPIPGREGRAVVEIAEAAYRSANTGEIVQLPLPPA